ncbi:hypothetical protein PISMIDRAFT_159675 [Pisolithus microcarpus 441]|uniref:Uncharacterized protein n=1 Tax=Pisolithus microcarpus 441 TaxID=765257 RepID=A0A0C9YR81_9AGAM|nr:hypothetical protein PISMIDRAFT_159675 [Pisolithus microcarpus 441]
MRSRFGFSGRLYSATVVLSAYRLRVPCIHRESRSPSPLPLLRVVILSSVAISLDMIY